MFRFKLQLRFLFRRSKKLVIDIDMLFPVKSYLFRLTLEGGREKGREKDKGKGETDWLEG